MSGENSYTSFAWTEIDKTGEKCKPGLERTSDEFDTNEERLQVAQLIASEWDKRFCLPLRDPIANKRSRGW